ncbi:MAG: leucine-rich repeat domain-containing protein [Oscillospiraceae bacterium]|nr:leucine-rich repeat domain-containing protein [Oscillospiraceae bacterium]
MDKACSNCFSAIDFNENVCPYCGFDCSEAEYHSYAIAGGTLLKERYVIGRVIGTGGFGITYLGYDTQCEKVIAIKEYYPHGVAVRSDDNLTLEPLGSCNTEFFRKGIERFLCEGKYIAMFETASEIMGVYDVFEQNGTAYYVMEYFNGITLKAYLDKYGRISAQQAVLIAYHISEAFSVIHKGGIIHRDVSPDNIMLCRNGNVKLIDFGAARSFADDDNGLSVLLKQGFTPLEQYQRNGKQGAWTDIYSLGASLYYALTLCMPDDPMSRFEDDSAFKEQLSQYPDKLVQLISRACEVRANERYQTAEELQQALTECGIVSCGFEEKRLRRNRIYPPRTELTYLRKSKVQQVRIAGEMMPIDLVELDLSDRQLTNAQIQNLRHLKKLEKLDLKNNFITDLSCLSGLTELKNICFNNNNVQDIEFARDMISLQHISGENSGVTDISPLKGKTELVSVFFGDAGVTDISPIKDCQKLVMVGFNEAQIGDIEALRNKPLLEMVCLSGCGLRDISPLEGCPNLNEVFVGRNKLTDLSPLKGKKLSNLFFDNNMMSQGIDTLEGISAKWTVAAEHNGFTMEQAVRVSEIIGYGTLYFEQALGGIWKNNKQS